MADWFTEITGNGRRYGEDLSFCIRAAAAGFAVHADTGARAGHVKPAVLGLPGTGLDGTGSRDSDFTDVRG